MHTNGYNENNIPRHPKPQTIPRVSQPFTDASLPLTATHIARTLCNATTALAVGLLAITCRLLFIASCIVAVLALLHFPAFGVALVVYFALRAITPATTH